MKTEEKLKKIINYTSWAWKGCFTDDEKEEFLQSYLYELDNLKTTNTPSDSQLNEFCILLDEDIHNGERTEHLYTYTECLKKFDEYIKTVIN
jgi:hypothetical protein